MCVSSGDGTRMSKEDHVLAVVFHWLKPHPKMLENTGNASTCHTEKENLESEKGGIN
jgi:hypothetical protein